MAIGERVSASSTTGFSSMQTTGARWRKACRTGPAPPPCGDVLLVQLSRAPRFFPATASGRRFPAGPDGFSPLPWYQLEFDHLFGQQAHRPARPSGRRLATSRRMMRCRCSPSSAGADGGGVVRCALQPALLIALAVPAPAFAKSPRLATAAGVDCPVSICGRPKLAARSAPVGNHR